MMLVCFVGNYQKAWFTHSPSCWARVPFSSVGMRQVPLGFLFWGPRRRSSIAVSLLTDTESTQYPLCSRDQEPDKKGDPPAAQRRWGSRWGNGQCDCPPPAIIPRGSRQNDFLLHLCPTHAPACLKTQGPNISAPVKLGVRVNWPRHVSLGDIP